MILGHGELVLAGLPEKDQVREAVEPMVKAAGRARSLTRQLLAFSRQQVLQPRALDLNACVSDTLKMLRRLIGEDVELRFVAAAPPPLVMADPGQLEQDLLNLAVNARDAMPRGGRRPAPSLEPVNSGPSSGRAPSRCDRGAAGGWPVTAARQPTHAGERK